MMALWVGIGLTLLTIAVQVYLALTPKQEIKRHLKLLWRWTLFLLQATTVLACTWGLYRLAHMKILSAAQTVGAAIMVGCVVMQVVSFMFIVTSDSLRAITRDSSVDNSHISGIFGGISKALQYQVEIGEIHVASTDQIRQAVRLLAESAALLPENTLHRIRELTDPEPYQQLLGGGSEARNSRRPTQ